jgi:signal peptidase
MRKKTILILTIITLFIYALISKLLFPIYEEIATYIINPVMWLIIMFLILMIFNGKNRRYFKFETDIRYIVISITLLYNIIFYTLGIFFGYANNPYSGTISGIFINIFTLLSVTVSQEYIKSVLVNESLESNNRRYLAIIFMIFVLSDINFINLYQSFGNFPAIADRIVNDVMPVMATTAILMYLTKVGGSKLSIIYKLIVILPMVISPILSNIDVLFISLSKVMLALITYLFVQNHIDKREKKATARILIDFNPFGWVVTFVLIVMVVLFGVGAFSIIPVVILTGSMKPSINPGDLVLIEKCEIDDIKVGDIIQYKIDNYTVIHRVINIYEKAGKRLVVKGDNNSSKDSKDVISEQIVGKVKLDIPYVGYPSYFIRSLLSNGKQVDVEVGVD